MHYETLRKELKEARESGQPWHVLADLLRKGLATAEQGTGQGITWRLAARETQIPEVMLRRYLSARERLEAIEREGGLEAGSLLSGAFFPAEKALRLHEADPVEGLKALREIKERKITMQEVRRRLEQAGARPSVVARQTAIRDRGVLVERCEGLVAAEAAGLYGPGTVSSRRPSARYLRRVGFEFKDPAGSLVGGADLYLPESGGRDPLETLPQSLVLAGFLPSFHVVLGPDLDETDAARAADALEVFEAASIGVLLLKEEGPAKVVRPARPNPPSEDRLVRYTRMLRHFATGRSPLRD